MARVVVHSSVMTGMDQMSLAILPAVLTMCQIWLHGHDLQGNILTFVIAMKIADNSIYMADREERK
jgi:hypothetical protein